MKRRLLSALLAMAMLLTMAPTVAFAAEGYVAKIGDEMYATLDAAITEEGVKLDRLMLVPGNQYQISLTVNDGVKDNVIDENLIVKLPEDAQFEAGKYYTLEVLVNSPEEVSINVVYTDWVEGGQGGSIEI